MQRSLVIIKPDGAVRRAVGAMVIKALLDRGLRVRAFKEMRVSKTLAEMHYAVHKDKPFFAWLVDFLTSARVIVMILEGEHAIQQIRDALGATFVQKATPDSLRGRYGLWGGINIAHASDGPETAEQEIRLWMSYGGLQESEDAQRMAEEYIRRYGRPEVDYTQAIRDVIATAIKTRSLSSNTLSSLSTLLMKDAQGVDEKEIQTLSNAILTVVREEILKSS